MVGTLRGRLLARDAVSSKGKRASARNTMGCAKRSNAATFRNIQPLTTFAAILASRATFRNIQRPYHRTGENRRIATRNHKTPECSNGYRRKERRSISADRGTLLRIIKNHEILSNIKNYQHTEKCEELLRIVKRCDACRIVKNCYKVLRNIKNCYEMLRIVKNCNKF